MMLAVGKKKNTDKILLKLNVTYIDFGDAPYYTVILWDAKKNNT